MFITTDRSFYGFGAALNTMGSGPKHQTANSFFFFFKFLLYFTLQYCIGFAIHWLFKVAQYGKKSPSFRLKHPWGISTRAQLLVNYLHDVSYLCFHLRFLECIMGPVILTWHCCCEYYMNVKHLVQVLGPWEAHHFYYLKNQLIP